MGPAKNRLRLPSLEPSQFKLTAADGFQIWLPKKGRRIDGVE
jgi:hypothetical protein